MRKVTLFLLVIFSVFLSGCSLLEEVNSTLEYANKATEHINHLNEFGRDVPQLIQDAASNSDAKVELENQLTNLLEEINQFNQINSPEIAESVHQKIVAKNEELNVIIENAMVKGELALDQLENSTMLNLINEITKFRDLVEDLGL